MTGATTGWLPTRSASGAPPAVRATQCPDPHDLLDFRSVVQRRVNTVSRLALNLARHAGLSMVEVAEALAPSAGACWSARGQGQPALKGLLDRTWELYLELRRGVPTPGGHLDGELRRLCRMVAIGGVLARSAANPDSGLAFFVRGSTLEVAAWIGPALVHTSAGTGYIHLEDALPSSVALALEGRQACDLLPHPALRSGRCPIRSVSIGEAGGGCVVSFRTGVSGCTMPWPELAIGPAVAW